MTHIKTLQIRLPATIRMAVDKIKGEQILNNVLTKLLSLATADGELVPRESMVSIINIRMPFALYLEIDDESEKRDISIQAVITQRIFNGLKKGEFSHERNTNNNE